MDDHPHFEELIDYNEDTSLSEVSVHSSIIENESKQGSKVDEMADSSNTGVISSSGKEDLDSLMTCKFSPHSADGFKTSVGKNHNSSIADSSNTCVYQQGSTASVDRSRSSIEGTLRSDGIKASDCETLEVRKTKKVDSRNTSILEADSSNTSVSKGCREHTRSEPGVTKIMDCRKACIIKSPFADGLNSSVINKTHNSLYTDSSNTSVDQQGSTAQMDRLKSSIGCTQSSDGVTASDEDKTLEVIKNKEVDSSNTSILGADSSNTGVLSQADSSHTGVSLKSCEYDTRIDTQCNSILDNHQRIDNHNYLLTDLEKNSQNLASITIDKYKKLDSIQLLIKATVRYSDDYTNCNLIKLMKSDSKLWTAFKNNAAIHSTTIVRKKVVADIDYDHKQSTNGLVPKPGGGYTMNEVEDSDEYNDMSPNTVDNKSTDERNIIFSKDNFTKLGNYLQYNMLFDIGFHFVSHKDTNFNQRSCSCPISIVMKRLMKTFDIDTLVEDNQTCVCKSKPFTPEGLMAHCYGKSKSCYWHLFVYTYLIRLYQNFWADNINHQACYTRSSSQHRLASVHAQQHWRQNPFIYNNCVDQNSRSNDTNKMSVQTSMNMQDKKGLYSGNMRNIVSSNYQPSYRTSHNRHGHDNMKSGWFHNNHSGWIDSNNSWRRNQQQFNASSYGPSNRRLSTKHDYHNVNKYDQNSLTKESASNSIKNIPYKPNLLKNVALSTTPTSIKPIKKREVLLIDETKVVTDEIGDEFIMNQLSNIKEKSFDFIPIKGDDRKILKNPKGQRFLMIGASVDANTEKKISNPTITPSTISISQEDTDTKSSLSNSSSSKRKINSNITDNSKANVTSKKARRMNEKNITTKLVKILNQKCLISKDIINSVLFVYDKNDSKNQLEATVKRCSLSSKLVDHDLCSTYFEDNLDSIILENVTWTLILLKNGMKKFNLPSHKLLNLIERNERQSIPMMEIFTREENELYLLKKNKKNKNNSCQVKSYTGMVSNSIDDDSMCTPLVETKTSSNIKKRNPKGKDPLFYIENQAIRYTLICSTRYDNKRFEKEYPNASHAFFPNHNFHDTPKTGNGMVTILRHSLQNHELGILLRGDDKGGLFLIWKGDNSSFSIDSFQGKSKHYIEERWKVTQINFKDTRGFFISQVYGPDIKLHRSPPRTNKGYFCVSHVSPDVWSVPTNIQLFDDMSYRQSHYTKTYNVIYCKQSSNELLCSKYMTRIYKQLYSIPLSHRHTRDEHTIYKIVTFVDIELSLIKEYTNDMLAEQFDEYLLKHKTIGPYQRLVPKITKTGTRIKLVTDTIFETLKSTCELVVINNGPDSNALLIGTEEESLNHITSNGILLSVVAKDITLNTFKSRVTYDTISLLHSVYGGGHNRGRCNHVGLATYRNKRNTSRPHPTPSVADEDIAKHQYFSASENTFDFGQPFTECLINDLGVKATIFGQNEHPQLFRLTNESCNKTILTSGSPKYVLRKSSTSMNCKIKHIEYCFFSFACTPHKDDCDMLLQKELVNEIKNSCKTKYDKDLVTIVGAGMPTTCQYLHVWNNKDDRIHYHVNSYFIYHSLGLAHELSDMTSFCFLGFAFTHCTSICYLLDNRTGMIHIFNLKDLFNLLAWGQSGGAKEYRGSLN